MNWLSRLRGGSRGEEAAAAFPIRVDLGEAGVHVTIHSHEIATARGPLKCWSYVTSGLAFWNQKEIVLTLEREPHETSGDYPEEPLAFFSAIAPYAKAGRLVDWGGVTGLTRDNLLFGGHVMYVAAQPLPGVEIPPESLAAIVITEAELSTVLAYGAMRVMARLGREETYFPCPPWASRGRLRAPRRIADTSILQGAPCISLPAVTATLDAWNVSIAVASAGRGPVWAALAQWSQDQSLAILTGLGASGGCLVWEPGMTGVNAITPPNSEGTRLAACFLLIAGGQAANDFRVIEDGIGLILTAEAAASLRDALMNGQELRLSTPNGHTILVESHTPLPPATIVLLYPESECAARGVNADLLALYIKELEREMQRASTAGERLEACDVFVALRGRSSKVWNLPPALKERLEQVTPPRMEPGPFAFVIRVGRDPHEPFDGVLDFPTEWRPDAQEGSAAEPTRMFTMDEAIEHAWPSERGAE